MTFNTSTPVEKNIALLICGCAIITFNFITIKHFTTMATITVKQYVMLLNAEHIIEAACHMTPEETLCITPYHASPIARIYCTDGTNISVQCHAGAHCKFSDVDCEGPFSWYASTFGKDLVMAETDCEELDQYGIDNIEDIEKYVEFHGGIDIEETTSHAVENAIKALEPYKKRAL